jgi:hypothetical protein
LLTKAGATTLYDGVWTRDEILKHLPGWEVVAQYANDMLLMNTAPVIEVSPTPAPGVAQYHHTTLATVIKQLVTPYENQLRRLLRVDSQDTSARCTTPLRVVSDHSWWALGNRLLGSMAALHVAACIGATSVEGLYFPEFGFETVKGEPLENPLHIGGHGMNIDLNDLRTVSQSGIYDGVVINAYGQRLEYFIAQRAFWQPLVSKPKLDIPTVTDDEVVIHIRCGDRRRTGRAGFPLGCLGAGYEYSPLPIDFYTTILDDLGLSPVFVGQIDDEESPYREYIESLRQTFPDARFISGSVSEDWEMIRRARNKILAISTFSWTAAWLGCDESRIVMPVAGLMNPSAWSDFDFIPRGDPRYTFRWVHTIPHGPKMSLEDYLEVLSRHSHGYPRVYKTKAMA